MFAEEDTGQQGRLQVSCGLFDCHHVTIPHPPFSSSLLPTFESLSQAHMYASFYPHKYPPQGMY